MHGDDAIVDENGINTYDMFIKAGRYKQLKKGIQKDARNFYNRYNGQNA